MYMSLHNNMQIIIICMYIRTSQIHSINGTMIANQFVTVNGQNRKQTVITFDNAATWQKIAAPTTSYCRLVRMRIQCMHIHCS